MTKLRMEYDFDVKRFMADIRKRVGGNTSLDKIAAATGITKSAFSRYDHGMWPDIPTFMQICGRLELTPGDYFKMTKWQLMEDET